MLVKMQNIVGGGIKYIEGEFQSVSNASVTVALDFMPDYLYIESQDTTKSYKSINMTLSDFPDKKFTINSKLASSAGITSISSTDTTRGTILSLDDTGFVWGATAGNANYATAPKFSYIAVKWTD